MDRITFPNRSRTGITFHPTRSIFLLDAPYSARSRSSREMSFSLLLKSSLRTIRFTKRKEKGRVGKRNGRTSRPSKVLESQKKLARGILLPRCAEDKSDKFPLSSFAVNFNQFRNPSNFRPFRPQIFERTPAVGCSFSFSPSLSGVFSVFVSKKILG